MKQIEVPTGNFFSHQQLLDGRFSRGRAVKRPVFILSVIYTAFSCCRAVKWPVITPTHTWNL
jgi:hypothetical protein